MTDLTEEFILRKQLEAHGGMSGRQLRRDEDGAMRYLPPPAEPTFIDEAIDVIGDMGQGLLSGAAKGAHNINRMIPGAVELENAAGAAFDAMGVDTSIAPPEGLAGQLTEGVGQMLPGMLPAVSILKSAGYGTLMADVLGGVIGDFVTSGKDEAQGIAELVGMIPGEQAEGLSLAIEEFITSDDATIEDLNSRIVGALPGAILSPAIDGLGKLVVAAKNSGAAQELLTSMKARWAQGKSPVPMGMSVEPTDGSFLLDGGFDVDINDAGDLLTTSEMAGGPSNVLPTMEDVLQARSEQMALKPKDRVQPSGETIFDTTPDGYNRLEMPQAEVPVPRAPEGKSLPKGNRAAPVVDMSQKISDTLAERMRPHLGTAAQYFYHTGPLVEKAVEMGIPEDVARKQLKEFALNYAATSPRTQTEQNLRNASLTRSKEKAGIPLDKQVGPGGDGINEKGYPMMIGESGIHRKLVDAIRGNEGIDVNTNPKPYTFAENVAGNLDGVTVDTHAIRGALDAMNEVEPGSIPDGFILPKYREAYKADPSQLDPATWIDDTLGDQKVDGTKMQTEYAVFSDIYRLAAAKLGVSPAEAQSLGWFGSGHRTGLASEMKTVVELIDDRIDVTSQIMNVDKETVFKGFMEGSIPLLSFGGAVLLGAGSEEDK